MKDVFTSPDRGALHLVVSWLVMVPLFYFASYGILWFTGAGYNNTISKTYGSLLAQPQSLAESLPGKVVFIFVLAVILGKLKSIIALGFEDRLFISSAGLALISCLWSQSATNTLHWSLLLCMNTLFVFFLYRRFSPRQQMELLLLLGVICLVASVTLALCYPTYGVDCGANSGAWRGIYPQKNMCAMATLYMLPAAIFLPSKSLYSTIFRATYIFASVFLIIMSRSQSSLIAVTLLGIFVIGIKLISKFRPQERPIFLLAGIVTTLGLVAVAFSKMGQIAYALGKDPSLTGRTKIWQAIVGSITKHPLLGYGYHSFWLGYKGESANISLAANWAVTSAHNGLLEVWLTLGAVGIALVGYSMLRALRDSFVCLYSGRSPYAQWCTCLVFLTIIVSLDEGELMMPNNLTWMLFMLACLGLSAEVKRVRTGKNHERTNEHQRGLDTERIIVNDLPLIAGV